MARASGLSVSTVQRVWRAFGLQPHRMETFKLSTAPDFVANVHDVVGLYMAPPGRALVLCIDEKSQIQALERSRPMIPMRPDQPARRTHDYKRDGTTSLFAALDVATGRVIGECYPRHRVPPLPRSDRSQCVAAPKPVRWTESASDILASIECFCVRNTTGSHNQPTVRTSGSRR